MAEINNFEDIKQNFEHINDVLDSLRAQNVLSAGSLDNVLSNINNRLEGLANDENTDLIKVFLAELKKSLEERHNFVSSKFSEIEDSFNSLLQNSQNQVQANEIKAVFDIIATNLNVFSNEFSSQKDIISQISLKIEEMQKDDSQKREVLRNISVLKIELEKMGNGFESIIINLNNNFSQLSEMLIKLDSSEFLDGIKKDIENVFLSSNAVLSTLQVIDHKNRELEEVLTQVVTKEDFNLERDQVAKLIAQNLQITDYLNSLPTQNNMENLSEKIDTSVGVITALKNMLTETGKQNQEMLTAQLDSLESKILNISTEDEFIGFRKELSQFAKEVMQSTDLMRSDLEGTNEELKRIVTFLNDIQIKDKFDSFANLSIMSENNIKDRIAILNDDIAKEIEKNKNLTKKDIKDGVLIVNEKIDQTKVELSEGSKLNLATILENVQGVINNIFSAKNALQIENSEQTQTINAKIEDVKDDLKDDITLSNNFIAQNAHENLKTILSSFENVLEEISTLKSNLSEVSSSQIVHLTTTFNETSQKIEEIKNNINENSQENYASMLAIVEDFSQTISALKNSLEQISLENMQETKNFLETVSERLTTIHTSLTTDAAANFSEVKTTLEDLTKMVPSVRASLEQSSNARFATLNSGIENLLNEIRTLQESSEIANQSGLSKILSVVEDFSNEFMTHKDSSSESAKSNIETISLYIQNLNRKIEDTKADLNENLNSTFTDLQNLISTLPSVIRENQSDFEDEKNALIEENSRNIQELGLKLEDLLNSFMNKTDPFNEEIINEFAQLNAAIDKLKERLNITRSIIEENVENHISDNIKSLEELISQFNNNYSTALYGLQNKLVEYFEASNNTSVESDLKLESSLRETSEIKTEIQSILEGLEALKQDSSLADLSVEMSRKFEGILLNITQMEGIFANKASDSVQSVLGSMEEKFIEITTSLKNYKEVTTEEINDFLQGFEEKFETVKGHLSLANTDIINTLHAKSEEMVLWLTPIRDAVSRVAEVNLEEIVLEIKNQIDSSYFAVTSVINENVKKENNTLLQEFADDFEKLQEKLEEILVIVPSKTKDDLNELKEVLDNLVSDIKTQNEELINDVLKTILDRLAQMHLPADLTEKIISDAKKDIMEKLEDLQDRVIEFQDENTSQAKSQIIDKIEEIEDILRDSQDENISLAKAEILDKLAEFKNETEDIIFDKITQSHEETKNTLIELLKENVDSIKENLSAINIEEQLGDTLSSELQKLETAFEQVCGKVEDKLAQSEENYTKSAQGIFSEIKTNFYEKVDDSIDELKSFIEILEDKKDLSADLDEIKSDIVSKFAEMEQSLEEAIQKANVKEDVEDLSKQVQILVDDLFQNIEEKFTSFLKTDENITTLSEKTDEITQKLEEIKDSISSDIVEKLNQFKSDFENQKKDFTDMLDEVKNALNELKESYIDLSLNSSMEMSDLLVGLREKIDKIEGKIENINFENISLPEQTDYTKDFEAINQKLDSFNIETDAEIKESIKEIKELVESQRGFIEQLDQLGKLSKLDNLESIKSDLQNSFKSFETKLNEAAENVLPEDTDHTKNVKQELNSFKKELFENLVEFFNQISFVSEAEDIKDFIDENSQEIKNSLKALQKELRKAPVSEDEDYSYTLQDVESDIAKVRIILKELAETNQEKPAQVQAFDGLEKLNENIMSISSRTNKLLLNSDESYNALKENLDDFKNIIYQLEGTIRRIDSTDKITKLEQKLDSINNLVLSGVKSDKIFNQTFMYLAEWVDNASENIGTVVEKMPEIDGIKMALADLKQMTPRRSDVETILDEISTKFDKQQEKINSLEEKLELLLTQSGLEDSKSDNKLSKKIDSIERQLSKLTESIATIASYVEE